MSRSDYFFIRDENIIAKGLSSVKYVSRNAAEDLYQLSQKYTYNTFSDLLFCIFTVTSVDTRQLDILIKIDYFSKFGNQRELLMIYEYFDKFGKGSSKKVRRDTIDGTQIEDIVRKNSTWKTKSGGEAKSYTLNDTMQIIRECEDVIIDLNLPDFDEITKVKNFTDAMGYSGYTSGREEDRKNLYVKDIYPLKRKRDGAQFGYSIITQSIGSGKESRFTVFNRVFDKDPIKKDDMIVCDRYDTDGHYFTLTGYRHIMPE